MKKKAIVFDCDDILLDYMNGIKTFLDVHYNIKPDGLPTDYVLNDWAGVSGNKMMKIISHYNEKSFEFGLLKPVHHRTVELMQVLHRVARGQIDFIILTKSGTMGHGEVLRKVNLMNVFGDIFKDIIIIEKYESKKGSILKIQQDYDILCFIDDYVKNIDDAVSCGVNSVVLERAHNVKHKESGKYTFMKDWIELYKYLDNLIYDNIVLTDME